MTPHIPPTPIPADGPGRSGERDRIEVAIEWTSGLAAVAMFAYGVALSYAVLYAIAEAAGLPPWARALWPGGWELFMASAALNALAEQRHLRGQHGWRRVPWYPLALTGLTAGGSILLNWFHPAIPLDPPPGWLTSLVYGLPPLEAVLAWHLFLLRIAHRRHQAPVPAGTVPAVPQRAGPEAAAGRDEPTGTARTGGLAHQPTVAGRPVLQPPQTAGAPAGPGRSRPTAAPQPTAGLAAGTDAGLLAQARAAAAAHHTTHGRPISRDALRQALRVSKQTAGALLRELRAGGTVADRQPDQADPDRQPTAPADDVAIGAHEPGQGTAPAAVAGNGAGGRQAGPAALVPTVPAPASDRQEGDGDA
jgi:hypothetical protein